MNDDDDDDICRNKHGGEPYSVAAHASIRSKKARDQARIYAWVDARGAYGAICEEAAQALDMLHQTASARFSEMKRDGSLIRTGRTRLTPIGGRPAGVVVTRGVDDAMAAAVAQPKPRRPVQALLL